VGITRSLLIADSPNVELYYLIGVRLHYLACLTHVGEGFGRDVLEAGVIGLEAQDQDFCGHPAIPPHCIPPP
jgi:hypothetical protein